MKKKQSACFELAVPVYTRGTGLIIQKGSLLRLTKSSNLFFEISYRLCHAL